MKSITSLVHQGEELPVTGPKPKKRRKKKNDGLFFIFLFS